jgi:hypothetical protein
MGESGRVAALGFAFAAGALLTQAAMGQSRSPAGDKGGAKSLGGTVVQFEEMPSRAVIYLEEKGGLVTPLPPPVERGSVEVAAAPKPATAPKAAAASGAKPASKSADRGANEGASPLRSAQSKPAPAPGAARP